MKKFLVKTMLFTFSLLMALYLLQCMVVQGLKQSNSVYYQNLSKINSGKIDDEVLVFGSSKAYSQFDPIVLGNKIEKGVYNLGLNGNNLEIQKLLLEFSMDKIAPEYAIQVVSNQTIIEISNDGGFYNMFKFFPYLDDEVVFEFFKKNNITNTAKKNLPLYHFFGETLPIFDGLSSFFGMDAFPNGLTKGYSMPTNNWTGRWYRKKRGIEGFSTIVPHTETVQLLQDIITIYKSKGITPILVYPPVFHEFFEYFSDSEVLAVYQALSEKNDVVFLDYSRSAISQKKENFEDANHLSAMGAQLFNEQFAKDLQQIITGTNQSE